MSDRFQDGFDDGFVSDPSQVAEIGSAKRFFRTAVEKRRIVEATLVSGASIARVARENGVNTNRSGKRNEHQWMGIVTVAGCDNLSRACEEEISINFIRGMGIMLGPETDGGR